MSQDECECGYRERSGGPSSSRSPHPGRKTTRSRQSPRASPPGGNGPTHTCRQTAHSSSWTTCRENTTVQPPKNKFVLVPHFSFITGSPALKISVCNKECIHPSIQYELPKHSQRESGDHSSRYGGEAVTDGDQWGPRLQRAHHHLQHHQPDEDRSGLQTRTQNHGTVLLQDVKTRQPQARCCF